MLLDDFENFVLFQYKVRENVQIFFNKHKFIWNIDLATCC